jgi:hypothetical protein
MDCTEVVDERSAGRPDLSGPEQTLVSDGGRFVVHYTSEGDDAVDSSFPPRVIAGLELGLDAFAARGWRDVPPDDGDGGDAAIDVYLRVLDINGYAHPIERGDPGLGQSCYLEVDPGLADLPGEIVESVAIHELHHCVQFAYTSDGDSWLFEGTASHEQYLTLRDPSLELALGVLWAGRLSEPDRPIDDADGRYEYAALVVFAHWEQSGGDLPAVWEALAEEPDWRIALDAEALRVWGTSFDDRFLDQSTWNAFACARDDGQHYDDRLPCVVAAQVPVSAATTSLDLQHAAASHTAAYFEVASEGDDRAFAVSCPALGAANAGGLSLVAIDAAGLAGESIHVLAGPGESLEASMDDPVDPEGKLLVVSTSTGEEPLAATCTVRRIDVLPVPGCGCSAATPSSNISLILALLGVVVGVQRGAGGRARATDVTAPARVFRSR